MAIRCGHVHNLSLQKSFKFWVAVATQQVYRNPFLSVISVILIFNMHILNLMSPLCHAELANAQHKNN